MEEFVNPPRYETIDQVDRVMNHVDNKILDIIGHIANSCDAVSQGLTMGIGTILQKVGREVKKDISQIARSINRISKKVDDNTKYGEPDRSLDNRIKGSITDDVPVDIGDIDLPHYVVGVSNIPAMASGEFGRLDLPGQRIDPDIPPDPPTCDEPPCSPAGDDPPLPPPLPPPPDPPIIPPDPPIVPPSIPPQDICPHDSDHYRFSRGLEFTWHYPPSGAPTYIAAFDQNLAGIFSEAIISKGYYLDTTKSFTARDEPWLIDHGYPRCGRRIDTVVNIPFTRNSKDRISIYTEEGENLVTERWNTNNVDFLTRSYTNEEWLNYAWGYTVVQEATLNFEYVRDNLPNLELV